jgi:hypothetical protein
VCSGLVAVGLKDKKNPFSPGTEEIRIGRAGIHRPLLFFILKSTGLIYKKQSSLLGAACVSAYAAVTGSFILKRL